MPECNDTKSPYYVPHVLTKGIGHAHPSTSAGVFRPCLGDMHARAGSHWVGGARGAARVGASRAPPVGARGAAMATLPPAEQWCVCAPVWQLHRRCQDRETLRPAQWTRKFGCLCRLGHLEKRRADYDARRAKKVQVEELRAAAPVTRAQFTTISGVFGARWSPSPQTLAVWFYGPSTPKLQAQPIIAQHT